MARSSPPTHATGRSMRADGASFLEADMLARRQGSSTKLSVMCSNVSWYVGLAMIRQ